MPSVRPVSAILSRIWKDLKTMHGYSVSSRCGLSHSQQERSQKRSPGHVFLWLSSVHCGLLPSLSAQTLQGGGGRAVVSPQHKNLAHCSLQSCGVLLSLKKVHAPWGGVDWNLDRLWFSPSCLHIVSWYPLHHWDMYLGIQLEEWSIVIGVVYHDVSS